MSNGPYYERGSYRCEIIDQGLTKASTGTVQVALKIKVLEGVQPPVQVDQQYERSVFLPVTERTMEYLVPKLNALGYTRDSLRYLNLNEPNAHDMRGTEAEFFCKHENDQNGQLRERWDVSTMTSSALDLKPPDAKEVRALDALFGRARKNGAPARPRQSTDTPPDFPQPATISNEDVPF
jgi:hypothetical protein